jgi:hypothetical protein
MNRLLLTSLGWVVVLGLAGSSRIRADDFRTLFNGKDLSGWVPVNVAPETFTARDGMIVSTGQPTGVMRTDRQYESFVIELEWRHLQPGGNAGLFIWSDALPAVGVPFTRSFEVQILDGRDGPNRCMATGWTRPCPPRPVPARFPGSRPTARPASGTGS